MVLQPYHSDENWAVPLMPAPLSLCAPLCACLMLTACHLVFPFSAGLTDAAVAGDAPKLHFIFFRRGGAA